MRHNVKKKRLSRPKAARELLLRNLATDLIIHGKIKTTVAKAKALQPIVDKLINSAKKDNKTIAIREVNKTITTETCSKKLINEIAKNYTDRNSGYTRISQTGFRNGDAAPVAIIELV